jgi:hypothetical protein
MTCRHHAAGAEQSTGTAEPVYAAARMHECESGARACATRLAGPFGMVLVALSALIRVAPVSLARSIDPPMATAVHPSTAWRPMPPVTVNGRT